MISSVISRIAVGAAAGVALTAAIAATPAPARACGGLFCSSANPVNQAAERILFVENGDGTVTAVIQIMYQGPAHKFAWVLPVAGNPKVGVSSNSALATLQQFTNPTYQLNTVFEGGACNFGNSFGNPSAGAAAGASASPPTMTMSPVQQIAAGSVGPYDYTVIGVEPGTDMPETAAIDWLSENGFDVGQLGPELLRPYLEEGLNLIAFKLQKGNDSGSIRPVMITYDASRPSIPIRPTAVAANDDMGVMVWTLSAARGVPANYKALELNEALINWFNPNSNYNDVVTRAADEAMGQGFVTEYAANISALGPGVLDLFPDWQEQQWDQFAGTTYTDPVAMIDASQQWSSFDGYAEAMRAAVTLPETISYEDFTRCTACYINDPAVVFDTQKFLRSLYEMVIKPLIETDKLLQSRPYLTRLYTTMSADEMTMDPLFEFNADLPDVSNVHTATRYTRCNSNEWRAELTAGTVYGTIVGTWPVAVDSQPAAMKILEFGTSGMGRVIEDRTPQVQAMNKVRASTPAQAGSGGTILPTGGTGARAGSGGSSDGRRNDDRVVTDAGMSSPPSGEAEHRKSGCSVASSGGDSLAWMLLACAGLVRRRKR